MYRLKNSSCLDLYSHKPGVNPKIPSLLKRTIKKCTFHLPFYGSFNNFFKLNASLTVADDSLRISVQNPENVQDFVRHVGTISFSWKSSGWIIFSIFYFLQSKFKFCTLFTLFLMLLVCVRFFFLLPFSNFLGLFVVAPSVNSIYFV